MDDVINIPESTDEMRIEHLKFLLELAKFDDEPNIIDKCRLNSIFTGIPIQKMKRYSATDNKNLFDSINEVFAKHTTKPCPLELTYEGQTYTFRFDFTLHPIDWDDDYKNAQDKFEENPIDLVSFCYIEKGMSYGESDEQQNPKNPRSVRNEVFKKHLPLSTYLDIQAFFLLSYNVLQRYLTTERLHESIRKIRSLK